MDIQSKSIKDMLSEGMSAADLMSALQEQIEEAEAEIRAEAIAKDQEYQKAMKLNQARYIVAEAMTDYMDALGIEIPTGEERDELIEELVQEYEKNERLILVMGEAFNAAVSVKKDKTPVKEDKTSDDIIKRFLDRL